MSKKRILIVSGVFPPEPVTSAYLNYDLANALSLDYDVTVLRPYPTRPIYTDYGDSILEYDKPFKCRLINSFTNPRPSVFGRLREAISFSRKCSAFIKKNKDSIDFIYNSSWQFLGYYLIARIANRYHIPYIVPIQDIYPECVLRTGGHNPLKEALIRCLIPIDRYYQNKAYKVRTISKEMAEYLSSTRKIPLSKYLIVNNWQNDEDYGDFNPPNNNRLIFTYLGSINVQANVELIIRAFSEAGISNAELKIIGGGSNKKGCETLAEQLSLKSISFDSVARENVPRALKSSDVLVLALLKGTAGLCLPSKITSYMLAGRAIIASVDLESATARYIKDANCGLVVPPGDVNALSHAFKFFSQKSQDSINTLGQNSYRYAKSNLTKEYNLGLVISTIKECLSYVRS